jgi:hypothetical protein
MALMLTVRPVSSAAAHHARMHVYRVRVFTAGRCTASNGTLHVRTAGWHAACDLSLTQSQ